MEFATQKLELNCIISTENNLKKKKMRSYINVTLVHGCTSKFETHRTDFDSKGNANFQLKDVNVESDYLRFQAFNHRKLLPDKHVGNLNVLVSDLVLAKGQQPSSVAYQLVNSSRKGKKGELKLSYKLSNDGKDLSAAVPSSDEKPEVESKRAATAIGNDIALFKMVPSFRTSLISLNWN